MNLAVVVFVVSFVALGNGYVLSSGVCPPPSQIEPCSCFQDSHNNDRVTALCTNFSDPTSLRNVFDNNPSWNLQDVRIENCTFSYIPASVLETATFQSMYIRNSTMVTLFDQVLAKTPELNLYLYSVKLLRGMDWTILGQSSLLELGAFDMEIRTFDAEFRDSVSKDVERLWFENTNTLKISDQAFSRLEAMTILTLKGGSIKKLSRDMFPQPTKLMALDFSNHKIAALPSNLFDEMPDLTIVYFDNNMLTTISEEVFSKPIVLLTLEKNPLKCNCDIKWITGTSESKPTVIKGTCKEGIPGRELETLTEADFQYCV